MLVGACLAPKHLEACLRNEAVWQSNGTASQMLSAVSHPGTSPWSSRGSAVSAAVHHVGDEVHDRSVAAALVRGAPAAASAGRPRTVSRSGACLCADRCFRVATARAVQAAMRRQLPQRTRHRRACQWRMSRARRWPPGLPCWWWWAPRFLRRWRSVLLVPALRDSWRASGSGNVALVVASGCTDWPHGHRCGWACGCNTAVCA